jgi:hypothetical protein
MMHAVRKMMDLRDEIGPALKDIVVMLREENGQIYENGTFEATRLRFDP